MKTAVMTRRDSVHTDPRCEEIGNIVTCLYYLSKEARRAELKEIVDVIDRAINTVVHIGQEELTGHLRQTAENSAHDPIAFLDSFCDMNDGAAMLEIREILLNHDALRRSSISTTT